MTRFARAKGSKSCNDKVPEDSTPWEVMKDQLLQAKKDSQEAKCRQEAEKQRIENYENFLKEQKTQKRKATWCDFPENNRERKLDNVIQQEEQPNKKKKKKNKHKNYEGIENDAEELGDVEIDVKKSSPKTNAKKKKKDKKVNNVIQSSIKIQSQPTKSNNSQGTQEKVKKKNKKAKPDATKQDQITLIPDTEEDNKLTESTPDTLKIKSNKLNADKETKKNKHKKISSDVSSDNTTSNKNIQINPKDETNKQNKKKKNKKKFKDGKPVRRKEINDHSFELIINGKEVELIRFDGFPIMKKDAERLSELKKNMMQKGIPKSEVQRTMKLERRRAEKALARLKRDVCYNCRKGGHNLSDCPDLKSKIPGTDAAEGVCFKCGSTEHRQFECKVQHDKEFRFAKCFICKESGHIARQCPDNPKGLYPNGGGCKLCGDVTHLRKDCPTVNEKKEEKSIKLQTLDSNENIEDIGQQLKTTFGEQKKPKKIKF